MTALIIIASLLFAMLAGTSWILVLVVRQNEKLRSKNYRLELSVKNLEVLSERDYEKNRALKRTIENMERGSALLVETLTKEHEQQRNMLERIIARLLQKQDEMIAGGGGSADPEDQVEEYVPTPGPLRVVESG